MRKTPTYKQKLFARKYIENKGNGTKTALEVYDTKDNNTGTAIASENLTKPIIQTEIAKLLEDNNLTLKDIIQTHKRNLKKLWPTSQTAVQDGYKLYGLLRDKQEQGNANIAIIITK